MKWLKKLFEKGCDCRGCQITRAGWGYAPCGKKPIPDFTPPAPRPTRPPRKP